MLENSPSSRGTARKRAVPLLLGEFSSTGVRYEKPIDYPAIMRLATRHDIGWLWWWWYSGATLDGQVKDARGKPVEGALVRWTPTENRNDWQVRWELSRADPATTDAEGYFHAEQVEPGVPL